MISRLECVYKGIKEVKAGSFVNSNGQNIEYKGGYKIVFDQVINNIPKETELKIDKNIALNIIPTFKPYDKIVITFDIVVFGNNNISIKINSVEKLKI